MHLIDDAVDGGGRWPEVSGKPEKRMHDCQPELLVVVLKLLPAEVSDVRCLQHRKELLKGPAMN